MLVLDTTTKSIVAVLAGAIATTNPDFTVAFADNTGTAFTEGANDGAFNGTSSVTLVSAPAAATRRIVKSITIENKDTAAVTVTLSYNNNATLRTVVKVTLQVGDTWTTDGAFDTNGNLKQTMGVVNLATQVTGTLPVANGGTGITSFGTGVATFLGTPSSANLAAAVTDETGSGALVFATSPALDGIITTASGNLRIDPATQIVEVLGDGASIVGQIQLNCHVNSHGQKIASQPHSQAASNTLTLPGGTTIGNSNATLVSDIGTQTLTNKTLGATTLSGALSCADQIVNRAVLEDYAIQGSAVGNTGATRTLDLSVANFFSATLDQACTFTFSNPPASGDFGTFVLELTNGGAYAITYPASVDFVGGVAPTLTASGVDQLVFTTRDNGTTFFAFVAGLDIKST